MYVCKSMKYFFPKKSVECDLCVRVTCGTRGTVVLRVTVLPRCTSMKNEGLAGFTNVCIDYIAEHVSPRIAGRWGVQGAWWNRYRVESQIDMSLPWRVNESVCESLLFSFTICWTTYR